MKVYYDLHIHTGLSPCADNEMTPHNIVNMALLKGLDFIAITDHNRALNVKSVLDVAKDTSLLVIPGIEVETKEGIHVLCYFEGLEELLLFEKIINAEMPCVKSKPHLMGEQLIFDKEDEVIGTEKKMLTLSCGLSLDQVIAWCHHHRGLIGLAHINRESNSILTILGFIPPQLKVDMIEWNPRILIKKQAHYPFPMIYNSDAHQLGDILECVSSLEVKEKSIKALFESLRGDVR
jgi:3',5'-nucleoside bisphosphate phosphatase